WASISRFISMLIRTVGDFPSHGAPLREWLRASLLPLRAPRSAQALPCCHPDVRPRLSAVLHTASAVPAGINPITWAPPFSTRSSALHNRRDSITSQFDLNGIADQFGC